MSVGKAKRMTWVEGRYRGDRDYWQDSLGNRYHHRGGNGVAFDPYVYQWHDPGNCYHTMLQRLMMIDVTKVRIIMSWSVDRITLQSHTNPTRKVEVFFSATHDVSRAEARSGESFGGGQLIAECNFATEQSLDEFVTAVADDFVLQKMKAPAATKGV